MLDKWLRHRQRKLCEIKRILSWDSPPLCPAQIYHGKINKSPTICLLTLMPHPADMLHWNLMRHKNPILFIRQQCGVCFKETEVYFISENSCEASSSQITKKILDHHPILKIWHFYLPLSTIISFPFFYVIRIRFMNIIHLTVSKKTMILLMLS